MLIDPSGQRPDEYEGALMAGAAYKDENISSYLKALDSRNWTLACRYRDDSILDKKLGSGLEMAVFVRTNTGNIEIAIAFAGTNSVIDGVDDVLQAVELSHQYSKSNSISTLLVEKLRHQFNTEDITFVGHSLGGGLATLASYATGLPALVYNPAALSLYTKKFNNISHKPNVKNYISSTNIGFFNVIVDPLRIGQRAINTIGTILFPFFSKGISNLPGETIRVPMKPAFSHGIKNMSDALKR